MSILCGEVNPSNNQSLNVWNGDWSAFFTKFSNRDINFECFGLNSRSFFWSHSVCRFFFFSLFSTHNLLLYFHLRRWIYYPYQSFSFEFSSISGGHIIKWNFSSPKVRVCCFWKDLTSFYFILLVITHWVSREEKINKFLQVHGLLTRKPVSTLVAQFFFYIIVFTLEFARVHSY